MANYNIVIDTSNFKPFDINPAISILNAYAESRRRDQEVYDAIAKQLGELATAVGGTEKAKAIWEAYNGDLQAAMADFAQGSNQATKRALSAMRQRYFKDVVPLEKAREAMLKNLDSIRNRSAQDGTLIHEDLHNLDYYLDHPDYTPRSYSGAMLTAQVEHLMENVANAIVNVDSVDNLDPFTKKIVSSTGLGMDTIRQAMSEYMTTGDTSNPVIQSIMQGVWRSAGLSDWDMSEEVRNRAMGYAAQGMARGIGTRKIDFRDDTKAIKDYEQQQQLTRMAVQHKYNLDQAAFEKKLEEELELKKLQMKAALGGEGDGIFGGIRTIDISEGATSPEITEFGDLLSKLYTSSGGLSKAYFGRSKEGWNITNPMKIREAYDDYMARYNNDKTARSMVKRDFGGQDYEIISKKEYDMLKKAGLRSGTSAKEFQSKISSYVHGLKQRYYPTSLNFTDYKYIAPMLETVRDMDTGVWEAKPDMSEGKEVGMKKLFGTPDGNTEAQIIDVAYSIVNPTKLVVFTKTKAGETKRYYVSGSMFSKEVNDYLKQSAAQIAKLRTPEDKAEAQEEVSRMLQQLFRNQAPIVSTSISAKTLEGDD